MQARRQVGDARLKPVARDGALALVFAGALLGCAAANSDHGGYVDAFAVVIALAACAPVAARSIDPLWSLAGVTAGAYLALATFKPQAMVILPVAYVLWAVAETGTRRRTAFVGLIAVGFTVLAVVLFAHKALFSMEVLEKIGLIVIPLLLGEAMREHKATREKEAEQRVEQERLRIARDVHDVVAHSMVAINVQAGVAAHLMDRRPEAARDALLDIKQVSGDALRDLRATLGVLRSDDERAPAPVRPAPGFDGLDELAARLRAAGIDVDVSIARDGRRLPSALEGAGFRIVQEALTNVLRHSGATSARVDIAVDRRGLSIEVVDGGPCEEGVTVAAAAGAPPAVGSGNGLRGMRERAAAVGGSLEAGPGPDGGWRVAARLPIGAAA